MFGLWKDIDENVSESVFAEFVNELMDKVNLYVTHPKPRGLGGAPVINDCTSSMLCGLEALGRCRRMDIVSDILDKLIEGKDHLKGPDYVLWMSHIQRSVDGYFRDGNFAKLFELNPKAFEVYFSCERTSSREILMLAKGLKTADISIRKRFMEMAEEHKGVIMNLQETLFEEHEFICDNEKKEENPILAAIKKMNQ